LTYALHDVCEHEVYLEPLRAEWEAFQFLSKNLPLEERSKAMMGLPFLDSFLKESARMHPATTSEFS
jgi:hypothetical protein